ncbi:hypothetical protein LAWASA_1397 [Lawsonibacter asaccharolyticus]|nr:hypothetical protein LAWASA_1397 [Lawsonibacter asaccharolyticus]
MKYKFKRHGLTLQWRLALTSAAILAAACLILTLVFNHSAGAELDDLEIQVIQLQPNTGDAAQISGGAAVPEQMQIPQHFSNSRSTLRMESAAAMLLVVLLSGVMTYWLTGKALSPLRKIAGQMETIQAQNLAQPVEVPGTEDEVAHLAKSFNAMLSRLGKSFETQKRFSANAAHELRTPLAVIQARLDLLDRKSKELPGDCAESLEILAAQTERLSHLVEELLQMARLETVQKSDQISLPALLEEILCDLEEVAQKNGVKMVQHPSEGELVGNDALLYRAIYNVIENSIKYNHTGGRVSAQSNVEKGQIIVTISDSGRGIPAEDQKQVFDPFFRVDKSRSRQMGGCGLGLALTKAIIELHGGQIRIVSSSPKGTTIRIMLPQ